MGEFDRVHAVLLLSEFLRAAALEQVRDLQASHDHELHLAP
jgi:hypothetical protein